MIELRGSLGAILLAAGLLAPILYVGTDLVAATLRPGYSLTSQSISVLTAPGAPTRAVVVLLDLAVSALVCVLGVTVWVSAAGTVPLRAIGCILIASAILQAIAVTFFPYHPGEAAGAPPNTLNVALMAPSIVGWFVAIGIGIAARQDWFRAFSIGLLLAFLGIAVLATTGIALLASSGHPESMVGAQERTTAYGFYLWMALLSIELAG